MVEVILFSCFILFFIGLFVTLFGSLRNEKKAIVTGVIGFIIRLVSCVVALIVALVAIMRTPEPPKYFPESEYSLEYIVTECGGKIDTTYVIIPKEK